MRQSQYKHSGTFVSGAGKLTDLGKTTVKLGDTCIPVTDLTDGPLAEAYKRAKRSNEAAGVKAEHFEGGSSQSHDRKDHQGGAGCEGVWGGSRCRSLRRFEHGLDESRSGGDARGLLLGVSILQETSHSEEEMLGILMGCHAGAMGGAR